MLPGRRSHKNAALVFAAAITGAALFQLALAAGLPWGIYAMGGGFPGQFPVPLRFAAIVQAALLISLAGVVMARAGLALQTWSLSSRWLVWIVVAFSALALVLNLFKPSAAERMIWAPVALLLLISNLIVACGPR